MVDCGPYGFPTADAARMLLERLSPDQRLIIGVSHEALMYRFPYGHPERAKRGERNPRFLESAWWGSELFPFLQPFAERVGVVVLRLAPIVRTEGVSLNAFVRLLAGALAQLPGPWRYAVDPGAPLYVRPEYLTCLKQHGVAHTLIDWGETPLLMEQTALPGIVTSDVVVVRANTAPGRMPAVRDGILAAVRRAISERVTLYVHLDGEEVQSGERADRTQFRMLLLLLALMRMLDADLGRLSPIRRKAA